VALSSPANEILGRRGGRGDIKDGRRG